MTNSLVILAGGLSSRMKKSISENISEKMTEQANQRSKGLILLNDRPMLDYILYNARKGGIKNVYLVIGKETALFKTYYGQKDSGNEFHDLLISYAIQHIPEDREKPLGTADAVLQAMEQYPELQTKEFIVCNCDNLYSTKAFVSLCESPSSNAFINYDRDTLVYSQERINRFALTKTDAEGFLEEIIEKPTARDVPLYRDKNHKLRVSMNIFKFDGNLFYPFLESCPMHRERNEKELPTALLNMIYKYPKSVFGIPFSEHVPDLTSKDDILSMNKYLSINKIKLHW